VIDVEEKLELIGHTLQAMKNMVGSERDLASVLLSSGLGKYEVN
jgi:hypothetical protein